MLRREVAAVIARVRLAIPITLVELAIAQAALSSLHATRIFVAHWCKVSERQ